MVLRMPRPPSHAPASWSFKDPATASQLGLRRERRQRYTTARGRSSLDRNQNLCRSGRISA
jgi:hypothetical protein